MVLFIFARQKSFSSINDVKEVLLLELSTSSSAAGIALIMGVDRILDMSRTAINVSGDLVAAQMMDLWVGSKLSHSEETTAQQQRELICEETGEDVLTIPAITEKETVDN